MTQLTWIFPVLVLLDVVAVGMLSLRVSLFPPFHAPDISFIQVEVSDVRFNLIKFIRDPFSSI